MISSGVPWDILWISLGDPREILGVLGRVWGDSGEIVVSLFGDSWEILGRPLGDPRVILGGILGI